jgi:DNA polymerase-3 subunit gamma/tau
MADTALARYPDFDSVLNLIRANRDQRLLIMVEDYVQLAGYRPGRIEFVPAEGAPADLAQDLGRKLQLWTGTRWAVSVVNKGGAPTQRQLREADDRALREEAEAHPLVQAVLEVFPQAVIREITPRTALEAEAAQEALPEVSEEWDPFEED